MKTQFSTTCDMLRSLFALLAAITLFASAPRAPAQGDTVTISAAEFQRMVYSAHLLTKLEEKPELDASLQVLLEWQRRNPYADPAALGEVLRQALARYSNTAPAYVKIFGYRDEVFAAYLEALGQAPGRTNFVSANLSLLNQFMLGPADYATGSAAELIHAGNQRLRVSEGEGAERQALVDSCTDRAWGNAAFGRALDVLLVPETLVSWAASPAEIITNTNSPLHGNPTMETLLALSQASGNGSLTISSNQLMTLFTDETQTLWDTVHTNLALRAELNQSQPDLLAYLNDPAAIDANVQHEAVVKQGQARKIASATAAILVQSKLVEARAPLLPLPKEMKGISGAMSSMAKGLSVFNSAANGNWTKIMASGDFISAGIQVFNLLTGVESPEDKIVREIGNIKALIGDLSTNMNYRFDRVDQSLTQVFDTLNQQFDKIVIIGTRIDHIDGDLDVIRQDLVDVQTDLHRLERHLSSYVNQLYARGLNEAFNTYLGYEARHLGQMMSPYAYTDNAEPKFFTHARDNSVDRLSSPYQDRDYTPAGLYWELTEAGGGTTNRLDQNLSYLKQYLSLKLSQTTDGPLPLANPRDWFVGAYAYVQLSVENPVYYRTLIDPVFGLDLITGRGVELTNFFHSLTFKGTNLNWDLHQALLSNYSGKLGTFLSQVNAAEQNYAAASATPWLETWRQWEHAVPRATSAAREVQRLPLNPSQIARVAAGSEHSLALKQDRTVIGWGRNDYGQASIPAGATNVVAIAAKHEHSLALKQDGTVVGFGANSLGQTNVPEGLSNVVAIATSGIHCLAAKTDGSVVAWGYTGHGACDVPTGLSNVVGVAASDAERDMTSSLALKADGTIVEWGDATGIPPGLSNVVAIAAGDWHYLALKANGTVVAWGYNGSAGETNVPGGLSNVVAIAAGEHHSLALQTNGIMVAWGESSSGQCAVPVGLTNVVAIAGGGNESLAVLDDGTVLTLPRTARSAPVPADLTDAVAIAAGAMHSLALRDDGTVAGWGAGTFVADPEDSANYGQALIPTTATNVAAVAAGRDHSLALKNNGTVVGWGYNWAGQATGVPNTVAPYASTGVVKVAGQTLSNAVAIAAGSWHSLGLKADGKVVGWGENYHGQINAPAGATNVVAVAAGGGHSLALRADGTVVGWGYNVAGQATGVRTTSSPYNSTGVVVVAGRTLTNVVAIAAGYAHSLGLKADGTVVGWGDNYRLQITLPGGLSNVVAIAAGDYHGLALKADGTVAGWGGNDLGQATGVTYGAPGSVVLGGQPLTNVVAIAAGADFSCFLLTTGPKNTGTTLLRGAVPGRVMSMLRDFNVNEHVLTNLDLGLHEAALELSGSKALLQAVLELGLPYTLERDDVLHGFFYGSDPLADLDVARQLVSAEATRLDAASAAPPLVLQHLAPSRFTCFTNRLHARLSELAAGGQPETPRLVGHTLRLLNLLREAWDTVPPPTLEIGRTTNSLWLVLYAEPYAHYTLQYSDNLRVPGWLSTTITNLHNEQSIAPPVSGGSQRFYRTARPAP